MNQAVTDHYINTKIKNSNFINLNIDNSIQNKTNLVEHNMQCLNLQNKINTNVYSNKIVNNKQNSTSSNIIQEKIISKKEYSNNCNIVNNKNNKLYNLTDIDRKKENTNLIFLKNNKSLKNNNVSKEFNCIASLLKLNSKDTISSEINNSKNYYNLNTSKSIVSFKDNIDYLYTTINNNNSKTKNKYYSQFNKLFNIKSNNNKYNDTNVKDKFNIVDNNTKLKNKQNSRYIFKLKINDNLEKHRSCTSNELISNNIYFNNMNSNLSKHSDMHLNSNLSTENSYNKNYNLPYELNKLNKHSLSTYINNNNNNDKSLRFNNVFKQNNINIRKSLNRLSIKGINNFSGDDFNLLKAIKSNKSENVKLIFSFSKNKSLININKNNVLKYNKLKLKKCIEKLENN